MGHIDHGGVELLVQPGYLCTHLDAQFGVEIRERFIHQKDARFANNRAPQRHALALAPGKRTRFALQVLFQPENLRRPGDALFNNLWRHLLHFQAERHIVIDRHMRVQRVVLEYHRDITRFGGHVVHPHAINQQIATADGLKPCDHAQRGGFPAA